MRRLIYIFQREPLPKQQMSSYVLHATILLICCIIAYFLLKKFSMGHYIANDSFSMQKAIEWECDFELNTFTFLPKCITEITAFIYERPLFYFAALVLFLFLKLLLILNIFTTLSSDTAAKKLGLVIAAGSLFFLTIGGGSHFLLGSSGVLTQINLYTRNWGQILILTGILAFINRRFFTASIFLSVSILLQALNSLNVIAILALSFLLIVDRKTLVRAPLYFIPIVLSLSFQYWAAFGLPELFSNAQPMSGALTSPTVTIQAWYAYVYSQDPDDLSILFSLRWGTVGIGYIVFILFGLYFASRTIPTTESRVWFRSPGLAIGLCGALYILFFALVEYFQTPSWALEFVIRLQPRRVMYIPIMFCAYFIVRYISGFFLGAKRREKKDLFVILAFFFLMTTSLSSSRWDNSTVPSSLIIIAGFALAGLSVFSYFLQYSSANIKLRKICLAAVVPTLIILTLARAAPHTSGDVLSDLETVFFTTEHRTYPDYIQLVGELEGESSQTSDLLNLAIELKELVPTSTNILSIGISQKTRHDLRLLSGTRILAADAFSGHRASTTYHQSALHDIMPQIESNTGLSLQEFIKLGRKSQIELLNNSALLSLRRGTLSVALIGVPISFVILTQPCEEFHLIYDTPYSNGTYCLLDLHK